MTFHASTNITEQIADHLAELVVQNRLAGGTRIQELKIARELGVSRGSVRESLLLLERRHLIEILPRRGAVVTELLVDEAFELIETLVANEKRLVHKLIASDKIGALLDGLNAAVVVMERAAREADRRAALAGRQQYYAALLAGVSRYTRALFDCLLPTSQRLTHYLLGNSNIDLHDLSRFYRAMYGALAARDDERIDELLAGYEHRLGRLTHEAFGGRKRPGEERGLANGASVAQIAAES